MSLSRNYLAGNLGVTVTDLGVDVEMSLSWMKIRISVTITDEYERKYKCHCHEIGWLEEYVSLSRNMQMTVPK